MSASQGALPEPVVDEVGGGMTRMFSGIAGRAAVRRFRRSIPAMFGLTLILVIVLASFLGGHLAQNPNAADVTTALQGPTHAHFLGTDDLGRDMLARLLAGGRASITVAVGTTVLAFFGAMVLGVVCGYFGGVVDDIFSRIFDVIVTFPMLLLAVLIVVALGKSLTATIVAISIALLPRYGRQFRVLSKYSREREYVQAALVLRYSTLRILVRHVLPNVFLPVAVLAAGYIGRLAVAEAALSFLGAGVQAPNASWGNMIAEGEPYLQYHPMLAIWPGLMLFLLSLSFSFCGDALRDAFDLSE